MPITPLLADLDIRELFWLAFLVITFLSWLVKKLKDANGGGRGAPPAPRPADKPLRSEIEVFLKELTKGQPNAVRPPPPPRKSAAAAKGKPEKPRKSRPAEPLPQPAPRTKPGARLETQHLSTSQLGQGLKSHVSTYLVQDRVTAEAQKFVGDRVDAAVQADLGDAVKAAAQARGPHPVLALLSQPAGIQQALVLNEILQKPRALRKQR